MLKRKYTTDEYTIDAPEGVTWTSRDGEPETRYTVVVTAKKLPRRKQVQVSALITGYSTSGPFQVYAMFRNTRRAFRCEVEAGTTMAAAVTTTVAGVHAALESATIDPANPLSGMIAALRTLPGFLETT